MYICVEGESVMASRRFYKVGSYAAAATLSRSPRLLSEVGRSRSVTIFFFVWRSYCVLLHCVDIYIHKGVSRTRSEGSRGLCGYTVRKIVVYCPLEGQKVIVRLFILSCDFYFTFFFWEASCDGV